jgi:predicted neutral ceramidase superfamily lipid hydrolase
MDQHLADVRRYDALADAELVERIVKHLGVALHNPASATVDCAKDEEIERVVDNWCRNKLGAEDAERCTVAVRLVAETLARDGEANRVTFYYLTAKHLDLLDAI